ncbi:MAG: flavin monoamine oxidase family protein, partial [Flavisolibacter sp.]
MEKTVYDIIVIGAGATGLMAASEIAMTGKSVAVIEARDRAGGRIHTINDPDFELPVEMGAEFIHGKLDPTFTLLKKASAPPYNVTADIWQHEDGIIREQKDFVEDPRLLGRQFKQLEHDISVNDFIENYLQGDEFEDVRFTLKNYVEGYYAADTLKSSTFSLRDDLQGSDEKQYRAEGGYGKMIAYLYEECLKHDVSFLLSQPVKEVAWRRQHVVIKTERGIFEGS